MSLLQVPEPRIDATAMTVPGCHIYGDVEIGAESFVLFGAVIRGDIDRITIGSQTNIQDNVVIHSDPGIPTLIGSRVTVGHAAVIHGARVGDQALIGIGAMALNNSVIGEGAWLGAGSVLGEGREVPPWTLAVGTPARPIRQLTPSEIKRADDGVEHYLAWAQAYGRLFSGKG